LLIKLFDKVEVQIGVEKTNFCLAISCYFFVEEQNLFNFTTEF